MELFILLDALRRASAGRITAVMPYFGYARKERKSQPRERDQRQADGQLHHGWPARSRAAARPARGRDRGFFDVPTDHLTAHKILAPTSAMRRLRQLLGGRAGRRRRQAGRAHGHAAGAPIVFVYKRRPQDDAAEILDMAGDVEGRDCVVVEDIISTRRHHGRGGPRLKAHGARQVIITCTHPVLSVGAVEKLRQAPVDEVVVTNSIPVASENAGEPVTVLSVAPLLAEPSCACTRIAASASSSLIADGSPGVR